MAASRSLRRLLCIRELEEEQSRMALEMALGELCRLEEALRGAVERERRGRGLVAASAHGGEVMDRLAGLEEARMAKKDAEVLTDWVDAAELDVAGTREAYLARRVERRQAETLIEEAEARGRLEAGRREQQTLDDWYLNRPRPTEREQEPESRTGQDRWSCEAVKGAGVEPAS